MAGYRASLVKLKKSTDHELIKVSVLVVGR